MNINEDGLNKLGTGIYVARPKLYVT